MSSQCALRGALGSVKLQSCSSSVLFSRRFRTAAYNRVSSHKYTTNKQTILLPSKSILDSSYIHTSAVIRLAREGVPKNVQDPKRPQALEEKISPILTSSSKVTSAVSEEGKINRCLVCLSMSCSSHCVAISMISIVSARKAIRRYPHNS